MGYSLVTGATGVLGKEFCKRLVLTDDLFLTGRSLEKLTLLKAELLQINPTAKILFFPADLTDINERKNLFAYADENGVKFGGAFLVAGVDTQKAFEKYTPEKITFQTRVNFESVVDLTHGVLTRREKDLKVLAVASMCGTVPMPYFALYSATKSAVINFFQALRYEVKDAKITTLIPGSIPTRDDIKKDIELQGWTGKASAKSPEFVVEKALKGLAKNKAKVIPGAFNKVVYFFEKITPTFIRNAIIANKFKNKEKDNFI